MITPSRLAFHAYAADHGVVPVSVEVLADLETPLSVYAKLCKEGPGFLLESAEHGERWGRYSFVGFDPFLTLTAKNGVTELNGEGAQRFTVTSPLATLDLITRTLNAPPMLDLPLHGGAVGFIGYDAVREIERIPQTGSDDLGMQDVHMLFPRHVVALDHLRQVLTVVTNVVITARDAATLDAAYDNAVAATQAVLTTLGTPSAPAPALRPPHAQPDLTDVVSNLPIGAFEQMVEVVKEHIRAGDTFQTVLSQRFSIPTTADAFTLYRVLRVINPSPYLYLLNLGDAQIVGSSPEALVQVKGRNVETWPIAGTRPRGATAEADTALEAELRADVKERAEHIMLVDLARNDLGRVCEMGTVTVTDLLTVERYSHVMHLVSAVTGTLKADVSPVDVLKAVFPAGTVSGAPKVRAMEIIDTLEPSQRGPYAGAVGYVDFAGNLDTCITIRTVVLKDGVAHVQAGAGIVADSVPTAEEQETRNKAGAVLAAIRAADNSMLR